MTTDRDAMVWIEKHNRIEMYRFCDNCRFSCWGDGRIYYYCYKMMDDLKIDHEHPVFRLCQIRDLERTVCDGWQS